MVGLLVHGAHEGLEDLGARLKFAIKGRLFEYSGQIWGIHKTFLKSTFPAVWHAFLYARGAGQEPNVIGLLYCTSRVCDTAREAAARWEIRIVEMAMRTTIR